MAKYMNCFLYIGYKSQKKYTKISQRHFHIFLQFFFYNCITRNKFKFAILNSLWIRSRYFRLLSCTSRFIRLEIKNRHTRQSVNIGVQATSINLQYDDETHALLQDVGGFSQ